MTVSLVTGGCGFIGAAIVDALKARGDHVIVVDLARECPVAGVEYRRIDVTDRSAVVEACRGVDTVIHNASIVHTKQNKKEVVWSVNLGGTENMLEAAHTSGCRIVPSQSIGHACLAGRIEPAAARIKGQQ